MSTKKSNWADELINEYNKGRSYLENRVANLDKSNKILCSNDQKILNSMIENMTFAIEWMKKGRNPELNRGVNKKKIYQKQFFESIDVIPDITNEIYDINTKEIYMTEEEKKKVAEIFISWSHKERYCYIAHEVERKSFQEIADEMNLSKSTIQSYISRARKKVENALIS